MMKAIPPMKDVWEQAGLELPDFLGKELVIQEKGDKELEQ